MKKVNLILKSMLIVAIFMISTTTASAQLKTLILQQGNYQTEVPPSGCTCGMALYDCVCGAAHYDIYTSAALIHLSKGQTYVVITSQVLSGNTLQLNFSKLDMKLKSTDFTQKEEVKIEAVIARSLGYESLVILKGKYAITGGTSIKLNVKRGSKIVFPPNAKH